MLRREPGKKHSDVAIVGRFARRVLRGSCAAAFAIVLQSASAAWAQALPGLPTVTVPKPTVAVPVARPTVAAPQAAVPRAPTAVPAVVPTRAAVVAPAPVIVPTT